MNFDFANFIEGVCASLTKEAYDHVFQVNGEIFPNIENQAKWNFARTPTHIHLNDGANVYVFHTPEGVKESEDFPLIKQTGVSLHEFGKDATMQGTAQVHRADPGSIYFTLQDGHNNPTYTFKHVDGDNWRAMPKVHKNHTHEAFIKGVEDKLAEEGLGAHLIDALGKSINTGGRAAIRGVMHVGDDPLASAGIGVLAGGAYDLGKRHLYNSEEENAEETAKQRIRRYLLPAAVGGIGGSLLNSTFSNYYSQSPVYQP